MSRYPIDAFTGPVLIADPNAHAWAMSAFSRVVCKDRDGARAYIAKLTDEQHDALMEAGAVLIALAGEVL